jgi:hypothetical protein
MTSIPTTTIAELYSKWIILYQNKKDNNISVSNEEVMQIFKMAYKNAMSHLQTSKTLKQVHLGLFT